MYNSNYTHTCNPGVRRPKGENHKLEVKLSYKGSPDSVFKNSIIFRKRKTVIKFRKN